MTPEDLFTSGSIDAGQDIHAHDIITGIQQNFTVIFQHPIEPPPDLVQLRTDYLTYIQTRYEYIDIKGLAPIHQVTQPLPLVDIYIPLKAHGYQALKESSYRVAGRVWQRDGQKMQSNLSKSESHEFALDNQVIGRLPESQPIDEVLKGSTAMVLLGDPGAGKSTVLKVVALALAEQQNGPLPIILPLNAYARHLEQDECSLGEFLGTYYAGRQAKLKHADRLFQQTLAAGQAVVLLDGLDEVQARRPHLVRLVQDFVDEYVPASEEKPDQPTIAIGNRIIVTSRIVGYEDSRLNGSQWRTYTLTDFEWDDIDQFITHWTKTFAVSVHGQSELARETALSERQALLDAVNLYPNIKQLAANPLLLTILALIKYTGVSLPTERVKLYQLYIQALLESWNRVRSLDQYPVGPTLNHSEIFQVLASLALWLRQTNPTAGLISRRQLELWLTDYYSGEAWRLPRGEAQLRGLEFLDGIEHYTNLLWERGEGQYGFLHLTLEETLAAERIVQLFDEQPSEALAIFENNFLDSSWHEILLLVVGIIGVSQHRHHAAAGLLQKILTMNVDIEKHGQRNTFAGKALLDMGRGHVSRAAAIDVVNVLLETMQSIDHHVHIRRDAGDLLGRLDWLPEPDESDYLLVTLGNDSTGLDTFRPIPDRKIYMGKFPVTNYQFARFIKSGGYDQPNFWSAEGWAWRTGAYDENAPDYLQSHLSRRPPELRNRPFFWQNRKWNSPLYPVVGISWFEAEAYSLWLTQKQVNFVYGPEKAIIADQVTVRLPHGEEWESAIGRNGNYPWGNRFNPSFLNCGDSWAGYDISKYDAKEKWQSSESFSEAGITAVTTYPYGVSLIGVWDGCGNTWEWIEEEVQSQGPKSMGLRGGAWSADRRYVRVTTCVDTLPVGFLDTIGFRLVVETA